MGGIGRVSDSDDCPCSTELVLVLKVRQEIASRAKAFGMEIQYHNRSRLPADLEGGATYVSFDELLANADVLSLNLSLSASTRHIIGEPEFKKMKDGAVIINTARGALIDEKALVAALKSGKVRDRNDFIPGFSHKAHV